MKHSRFFAGHPGTAACAALAITITALLPTEASATDIIKTGVAGNLEADTSWTDGFAPTINPGDYATWAGTSILTAAGNALGANVSWNGIKVTDVTGALSIGNTAANTIVMGLGEGGIDMTAAAQNVTITNALALGANSQSWTVAGGRTLTIGAAINSGRSVSSTAGMTLSLAQSGTGTANFVLTPGLSGSLGYNDGNSYNTFAGDWSIGPNTRVVNIRNGATAWGTGTIRLNGGTIAPTQGNWTWTNAITLGTGTTSTLEDANTSATNRSLKLQGVISGSGNLALSDPNNRMDTNNGFVFTANNTMSGTVTIGPNAEARVGGVGGNDGTLGAGTTGSLGTAAVVLNAASSSLVLSRSNPWSFGNHISGAGVVRIGGTNGTGITGAGTQAVTLLGTNTYSGGTELLAGTLEVDSLSRIGSGYLAAKFGSTFRYTGTGGESTTRNLFLDNGATTFDITSPTGSLTWNDAAKKGGANGGLITKAGAGTLTIGGAISTGGATAVTISGGTLVLNGANAYGGATTVNAGTLLVGGTITGSVTTVNSGGTLGGTGTVGTVTVNGDGTLAPGSGVGLFSTGSVTLGAGATFSLEIDTTSAATDRLASNGTLTLSIANDSQLAIDDLNPMSISSGTYTFITYTPGGWNGGLFSYGGTPIGDDTVIVVEGNPFTLDYNAGGNSVALIAVPEPGACVAFAGGAGLLLGLRRRRLR